MTRTIFIIFLLSTATGLVSPPFALAMGLLFGLAFHHPWPGGARNLSRFLLQASVVALGFGMSFAQVWITGRAGILYTAVGITAAMLLGLGFGRYMGIPANSSLLTSAGTAICGGSAIAAVGPIAQASDQEMAMSLGTVFLLNSIALFLFPAIGWSLHLNQVQFGLWSALAIHDTSSVVGAAARYGAAALAIGTTVKLVRALWIIPLSLVTAIVKHKKTRIQWPWFILLFCLATILKGYLPAFAPAYAVLAHAGRIGMCVTLFLIGTGVSRQTLREVGPRPFAHGLILWIVVATSSLALIRGGWISIQ